MGQFKPFLFGAILGAGIAVCSLQFHVVRSDEGFRVIPRTPQSSLGLAYADVRNWDAERWADRPELVRAMVANGSSDLIAGSVASSVVDSVSAESGTLDQLRSFLNGTSQENEDGAESNAPAFLTVPNDASDAKGDSLEDLFTLPFPKDARRSGSETTAAAEAPLRRTVVAQRPLPAIDDILSAGPGGLAEIESPSARPEMRSESTPSSLSPTEETNIMEGLLFGSEAAEEKRPEPESTSAGVFEDVTHALENRTEQALARARRTLQDETSSAVTDSVNSVDRFVREQINQSVPEPVSRMFQESSTSAADTTDPEEPLLPAAIRAIQEGFDPFLE